MLITFNNYNNNNDVNKMLINNIVNIVEEWKIAKCLKEQATLFRFLTLMGEGKILPLPCYQ